MDVEFLEFGKMILLTLIYEREQGKDKVPLFLRKVFELNIQFRINLGRIEISKTRLNC